MTLFITTRAERGYDGSKYASCVSAQPVETPRYDKVDALEVRRKVEDKHVILAIHGFNVSRDSGVRSLAALERRLALRDNELFFGVLWPGDWWLPVINYPAEADDAVRAGRQLAAYVDENMAHAPAVSMVSHSLGGRVLLEAAQHVRRPVRELCVTAGAVDNDVLGKGYARAKAVSRRVSVLSSRNDMVLRLAYPLGDFGSDIFWGDNDSPWRGALGLKGPRPVEREKVEHWPIPLRPKYGHGDYFPPGGFGAADQDPDGEWTRAVRYIRRCLDGEPVAW
ncbi:alpha/beta hydrolase [Phenylobacterium sp. J426]|uniref:alpha/beta hydrolase n=1 Tax=Phenylobacterium sp. J426 TaxID=2898439 RepID=UPI00215189E2|nr:alpha/beta hydrolase [Phenylobacterium sp. J426]MCR5875936.1 alpha/beta hydrolase [Phenylobacterium sp. J426]